MFSLPYPTCACLLACCLVIGPRLCGAADPAAQDASTGTELSELQQEWADTVQALKRYSAAQRDTALARAEQTLDAMDRRIEQLEVRTEKQWDKLGHSAREARKASLRTLRTQRNRVAEWYGGMKHSSAGAWESVKQGFIDSYATLSESFGEAWQAFDSDKDAALRTAQRASNARQLGAGQRPVQGHLRERNLPAVFTTGVDTPSLDRPS
jgi:hypothetical protein